VSTMTGSSSSGTRGVEPSSKRAHPCSFLLMSSWNVHSIGCCFTLFPAYHAFVLTVDKQCRGDGSHALLVPIVRWLLAHPATSLSLPKMAPLTASASNPVYGHPGLAAAFGVIGTGGVECVDVSYVAPQAHKIVNVALHWECSPGIVFIFSQGRKDLYHV
jgi:hypothetical protein